VSTIAAATTCGTVASKMPRSTEPLWQLSESTKIRVPAANFDQRS
jgi:hypothetical protein